MKLFVDTSAIYALLDSRDDNHKPAREAWTVCADRRELLVTTNYVLVETISLLTRRLGLRPVREFESEFMPVLTIEWIDRTIHERAMSALLAAAHRRLSLVDCTSFEVMRSLGIDTALAFDEHFAQLGFHPIPDPRA